jgi:predicted aspartyl protease
MGTVKVKLKLTNIYGGDEAEIDDAVVDTGSIHTCIPRELAERLNLRLTGSRAVLTAAGPATLEETGAWVELHGKATLTPLLILDTLDQAIVGVTLLEWLGFLVDPVKKEIRETDILLL